MAEEEERKARQVVNKFVGMEGITSETAAAVEGFIADLDSLLKAALDGSDKKRRTDEEMIVLLTTRQLVSKYFCFTDKMFFLDEHFSLVIRDKISLSNMTAALLSFRNRGLASSNDLSQLDTAIPKLRLFSDSLVELIVNPSNFDINSFSSRKGGKSIITVFIFMLKNFLQQSRVLEALYSENSGQNNIKGLIQEENVRYVADSINCALNFMAYEHFRTDGSLSSSKFHRLSIPKPQVITVSGELFGLQGLVQLEKTAERTLCLASLPPQQPPRRQRQPELRGQARAAIRLFGRQQPAQVDAAQLGRRQQLHRSRQPQPVRQQPAHGQKVNALSDPRSLRKPLQPRIFQKKYRSCAGSMA